MVKVMGVKGLETQGPTQHNVCLLGVNSTFWERSLQKQVYQTLSHTDILDRWPGRSADLEEHL